MATASKLKPFRTRNLGTVALKIGAYDCPLSKSAVITGLRATHKLYDAIDTIRFYIQDKDGATQTWVTPLTKVQPEQSFVVSGQEIKDMLADGESLWAVASRDNAFDVSLYVMENG